MSVDLYSRKTLNHLLQTDFSPFYHRTFQTLHRNRQFEVNWHIHAISEFLMGMRMGQFKRGNINISPRFGKTLQCSVGFPMWWLGDEPWMNIICASYSAELSQEIHQKCRTIANQSWFKDAFPRFSISNSSEDNQNEAITKNTQKQFITTEGGSRIATSTHGSITGKGGDLIIGDDLMNPDEANSTTKRESCIDWCKDTLFSRFDDKKKGMFLNIQQRLHENDFTGTFVDSTWEDLVLPIRFDERRIFTFGDFKKEVKEGEWLDEKRYSQAEMDEDIKNMGSKNYNAQYKQQTVPADGEIFKKEYFKYFTYAPKFDYRAIYADTAQKEGTINDYSVFMCFGVRHVEGRKFAYLIDVMRKKLTSPKLLVASKEFWNKHAKDLSSPLIHCDDWIPDMYSLDNQGELIKFAIEDKSSGSGLIQDLEDETNIPITKLLPEADKISRANDILPRMESGQVLFPKNAPWLPVLEKELLIFSPKTIKDAKKKKDQVDTLTYAVKDLLFESADLKLRPMNYSGLLNEVKIYGTR